MSQNHNNKNDAEQTFINLLILSYNSSFRRKIQEGRPNTVVTQLNTHSFWGNASVMQQQ